MIFILNTSEQVTGTLARYGTTNKVTPYFDDKYAVDLSTGAETFTFSTFANTKESTQVVGGNFVAFQEGNGYKLFQISEVTEEHTDEHIKTAYCEMAGIELINEILRATTLSSASIEQALTFALQDTEFQVGNIDASLVDVHTIELKDPIKAYNFIQQYIIGLYGAEISYRVEIKGGRIVGKYIDCYAERGDFKGIRFEYGKSINKVKKVADFTELATALVCQGKNGTTISSVEAPDKPVGQDWIGDEEAYQLYNKNGSHIFDVFKYDTESPAELLLEARKELANRCKPKLKYEVDVELLGTELNIGDTIYVVDNEFLPPLHLSARVSQIQKHRTDPSKDKVILANYKEVVSKITDEDRDLASLIDERFPIGSSDIKDGAVTSSKIPSNAVQSTHIKEDTITTDHLKAKSITSDKIEAGQIKAEHILADQIKTEHLKANSIDASKIKAGSIETQHLKADIIESTHIKADQIQSQHIASNTITTDHLQANIINSNHIQAGSITAGSGIISEGAIGSAQISNLEASKIDAGTIDTSRVTIAGTNGHLKLKGNRLQVFDGLGNKAVERVSVGDVNGDGTRYGLRVRGADGETVLLDENGVTREGITDGSITNDKISDNAGIDGAKLNINSVVSCINEDGTEVIKGTKISVNGTNLETKLSTIENTQTTQGSTISQHSSKILANEKAIALKVDNQTYTADKDKINTQLNKNTSAIDVLQGEIALKVEQTDIENVKTELEGVIDTKVASAKADIKVTTDAISQNVTNLTQTVSTKADGSTVTTLGNRVGSLETSVNGISGKVSSLETTTTTLNTNVNKAQSTANTANNTANTNKSNISSLQTEVSTVKNNVASLDVTTSGISQKVSSLESTTTTLTNKVNTAQNTANSATTLATNANNKIDNLEVGGRNVFLFRDYSGKEEYTLPNYNNVGSFYQFDPCLTIDPANYVGEEFTVSFYAISPNGTTPLSVYNQNGNPKYFGFNKTLTNSLGNKWEYFTCTFTNQEVSQNTNIYNRIEIYASGKKGVKVKGIKIEKGNRATDWTPAPEGVQNQLDTNKLTIEATKSKVATLETDLSGITQRVSSTESTTSTLTTQVATANSNASNAVSTANTAKSTADTAKTTADSAKTTATNAQSTANTANANANKANEALTINQQTKLNGVELFNNAYKSDTTAKPFVGTHSVVPATEVGGNANEGNIIKMSNGDFLYTEYIPFNVNNPFYCAMEVYYKDTTAGTNYIQVCYYDKNKTPIASNEGAVNAVGGVSVPSANAWHKFEGWVDVPASTDARQKATFVRLRVLLRYNNQTGVSYIRNFSWKQLGSGLTSEIQTVTTRLQTAESKLTKDSLTTIIGNHYTTETKANDLITSKGYATVSQVQQTVNGLQVKVSNSGGYNLIYNGNFKKGMTNWGISGDSSKVSIIQNASCSANPTALYFVGVLSTSNWVSQSTSWDSNEPITLSYWQYTSSDGSDGTTNPFRATQVILVYTDDTRSWHTDSGQTRFNTWEKRTNTITPDSGKRVKSVQVDLWCRDTTKKVYYTNVMLEKGTLATEYTPNPNEIYDGITTIDKDGITVRQSNISTYTTMDASSFRVENNTGGTVAEFSQNSQIPNLTAGTIDANTIYASNICSKSPKAGDIHFIYVNGSTGNDNGAGTSSSPYRTVQRAIDDIKDKQDQSVTIYVYNSVPGFELKGVTGTGVITLSLQDSAVINGYVVLGGVTNAIRITNESGSLKATFKNGISIYRCVNVDIYGVTFRGLNVQGNNIYIQDTNYCAVNSCDLGGLSDRLLCAIDVRSSLLWLHNCRGSNITDVVAQYAFSHVMMARGGTSNVPDYSNTLLCNYDGSGRIQNWAGGNFVKTPSSGWNPAYTPTQKTTQWSFNKIWSDETLHGWSDRQELIQGYASTWNTGRWTGYIQMTDGMSSIRSTISGGTNLSGRIYIQRTSSGGNSTGSKLCLYASDGTLITNSTTINRSQGVWVSLSSSIIQKIQSGAITYFYLKADANNTATYFKCERNCKIEITYTK